MNRYCLPLLLAGMTVFPARSQELSAQEIFKKVLPSVVKVTVFDKNDNVLATGSGVVVAHRENDYFRVATNCHLVDMPGGKEMVAVSHGAQSGLGTVVARDPARDLCLLNGILYKRDAAGKLIFSDGWFASLSAPPEAKVVPLRSLEVGERTYAIGAPQGLELSLSEGLVSGLRREGDTTYIQTTAAISKGSSGGGLFDAQGRLVGITTMYLKDGQNLNFAIPAELIASVPMQSKEVADAQMAAELAAAAADPAEEASRPRDRWLLLAESSNGQKTYIDTQTVQGNGADVTVWVKCQLAKPEANGAGDTYDEASSLYTVHCGSRQLTQRHYSQRLRGDPVYSHDYKSYELEKRNVTPDTVSEAIYEGACGL